MSIKSKFRKDGTERSYINDIDQETLDFINQRSDEIKAEGVKDEFDFINDLEIKEGYKAPLNSSSDNPEQLFDPNQKFTFSWKENKWDVFFLAPVGIFTLITPYFGLYEYLIPFGLHEWAADNFDSFYRSLEAYSSNPMRDKVMYVWGSLFAIVWGVFLSGNAKKLLEGKSISDPVNDIQIGFKLIGLFLILLIFISFLWMIFHSKSERKGFKFDDVFMYLINNYFMLLASICFFGGILLIVNKIIKEKL